jgi:hypothetical protein
LSTEIKMLKVSECFLFNAKMINFSALSWQQATFDEMLMTVSTLQESNTLNWIVIVLAHFKQKSTGRLGHIIPIQSQPVFVFTHSF